MGKWTQAEIDVVRAGWDRGDTAAQIAVALAERGKITSRCAVLGVVHREKFQRNPVLASSIAPTETVVEKGVSTSSEASMAEPRRRVSVGEPKPRRRVAVVPTPRPPEPEPEPVADVPPRPLPPEGGLALMDLENWHCRWPLSEYPHRFCGEKADGSTSWCPAHRLRAFDRRQREGVAA
ncbi:GcrA family cell cycle regulator [Xanthobacter tagetidis]|nr:GcrA family cell cycle regulator [Xanthobacter tagetidis]MBB6306249.1 hypothetical protein [Xanthobacter tagetidis]